MKGSFTVNPLTKPHGNAHWRVEGTINGKRIRAFFVTKEEAQEAASIRNGELQTNGHAHTDLPGYLRIEALHNAARLEPFGISLTAAVDYYLKNHDIRSNSLPVAQACERFLSDSQRRLETGEIGKRHHDHLVKSCRKFVAGFGPQQLCDITGNAIEEWLNALKVKSGPRFGLALSLESKNSHRRSIHRLYWQSKKWNLVKDNPVTEVKIKKDRRVKGKQPGIFSVEEATKLLETAPEPVLPVIAIGLFGGLRPSEINRLCWENILWQQRLIDLRGDITKTASRRCVEMSDNLLEWLAPYRNATGPIFTKCEAVQIREVTAVGRAAGLKWHQDGLRHSYASYYLALTNDAPKTALQLGHENGETKTLHQHYDNRRTPQEAVAYWNIRPSAAQNITSFAA